MLLLTGYLLLAPPALVLGPLAGLLLIARPRSLRQWVWITVAAAASLFWAQLPGGLASQVVRAWAVLLTGSYLALTLWRPSGRFSRAVLAGAIGGVALAVSMGYTGIGWGELQQAVVAWLRTMDRTLPPRYRSQVPALAETVGTLFPALLALAGVAGLRLAWAWHCRLAERPLGEPEPPFGAFRFNDHVVWGWVAVLALYLLPLPAAWSPLAANLLLVLVALYAARGLAVVAAGSGRVPPAVIVALALVGVILLPFVLGGLTLLGLADTWLDFRHR